MNCESIVGDECFRQTRIARPRFHVEHEHATGWRCDVNFEVAAIFGNERVCLLDDDQPLAVAEQRNRCQRVADIAEPRFSAGEGREAEVILATAQHLPPQRVECFCLEKRIVAVDHTYAGRWVFFGMRQIIERSCDTGFCSFLGHHVQCSGWIDKEATYRKRRGLAGRLLFKSMPWGERRWS